MWLTRVSFLAVDLHARVLLFFSYLEGWKVCSEVLVFISELLALFEEFVL